MISGSEIYLGVRDIFSDPEKIMSGSDPEIIGKNFLDVRSGAPYYTAHCMQYEFVISTLMTLVYYAAFFCTVASLAC